MDLPRTGGGVSRSTRATKVALSEIDTGAGSHRQDVGLRGGAGWEDL
jgi:hypothetical protein